MNELQSQLDYLKQSSPIQYEYVVQRSMTPTANMALDKIQRTVGWLHALPNKRELQELSDQLRADRIMQASIMLQQATIKAVSVMIDDLDSKDRKLRQSAAKDILDRVGLRAPDKTQVEVMASVAVRALDDVLAQVYGKVEAPMIVDATFQDSNDDCNEEE